MGEVVKPGPFGPRVLVRFESDSARAVFLKIFLIILLDVLDGMKMIGMVHGSFGCGLPRRSYPVGPTPSSICSFLLFGVEFS